MKKERNPRFDTSLYNHRRLSTNLPLISNAEYMKVLEAIKNGDFDAYYNSLNYFVYEPKQQKLIKDIIDGNII